VTRNESIFHEKGSLFVSNHLSYLDILIFAAQGPTLFITSEEVRRTFFLGFMSALGGSLFVNRRSVSGVRRDINTIAGLLSDGYRVCFFPEATSTDGSKILPFKSSFFEAAKKAEAAITPLCIRYTSINGQPTDRKSRDYVCYYGDMFFFPHFIKLMSLRGIGAELTVLSSISTQRYSRKELAEVAYRRIVKAYI
jgi:1-acyl-sn-glycerol-3-phosphate acyltransferase